MASVRAVGLWRAVIVLLSGLMAFGVSVPPAQSLVDYGSIEPPLTEEIDWENRAYGLTCGGQVDEPVEVAVRDGTGIARGSAIGQNSYWEVQIQQILHGVLPGLGEVTSVLFYCHPQPTNYFDQELRVYRTGDGSEVGRVPTFEVTGFPPEYQTGSLAIKDGYLAADLKFYGDRDPHGHPSILRRVTWSWNGQVFVKRSEVDAGSRGADLSRERVTVDGIGPLRIGMSGEQAQEAVGSPITMVGDYSHCADGTVEGAPDGLSLRFMEGTLVAISVSAGAVSISTASGIHIGSPRDDLVEIYGEELTTVSGESGSEQLVFAPTAPKFSGRVIVFKMWNGQVEEFVAGERDHASFDACP